MKKIILLLIAIPVFHCTYAGIEPASTNGATGTNSQDLYKKPSGEEVSLEVERLGGEVLLHMYSSSMRNVDLIYVERSNDPTEGFTRCTIVKVSDFLIKSKNYIGVADNHPSPADIDTYYRIRTVSTTGATHIYLPVGLAPLLPIEGMEDEVVQK